MLCNAAVEWDSGPVQVGGSCRDGRKVGLVGWAASSSVVANVSQSLAMLPRVCPFETLSNRGPLS